jgi:shikimate dehydrogenase
MTDHYAVIGNPIAHSLSPTIHTLFATQTQQDLIYTAVLADNNQFAMCIQHLQDQGFKGANVTVPFKEEAFRLATQCTERANQAKAVNTLSFHDDGSITGDNTDGIGLVRDLTQNIKFNITNKCILIIGAGGAARGIIPVLLKEQPAKLYITNRTKQRALDLVNDFANLGEINIVAWDENNQQPYDLIINATSLSLHNDDTNFPICRITTDSGCYDLVYGKQHNVFLEWGKSLGAKWCIDGLGMLVEQAAEAFSIWRGIHPQTQPVLQYLLNRK